MMKKEITLPKARGDLIIILNSQNINQIKEIINGYKEKIERFWATEKGLRKGRSTQVLP